MISHLRGTVRRATPGQLVIDVGGVGFGIEVPDPLAARSQEGEEIEVATKLMIRPDAVVLFGFSSNQEREVFTMLTSISGVGPKTALAILSTLSPGELASAILEEDVKTLMSVKGIGKRSARRIIVELSEKIAGLAPEALPEGSGPEVEAVSILVSLGCDQEEAVQAVEMAREAFPQESSADRLVMAAMRHLQV